MNAFQMLDRILGPVTAVLTPEATQRLVALRPDAVFQDRLDELATKSNHGELTDVERKEYEDFVDTVEFISLLQAKARKLLEDKLPHGVVGTTPTGRTTARLLAMNTTRRVELRTVLGIGDLNYFASAIASPF